MDGCEVWGYENTDIIEEVHTKFCKLIFGVSKFSHNMGECHHHHVRNGPSGSNGAV